MSLTVAILMAAVSIIGLTIDIVSIVQDKQREGNTVAMLSTQHAIVMEALNKIDNRVDRLTDTLSPLERYDRDADKEASRFIKYLELHQDYNIQVDTLYNSFKSYVNDTSKYDSLFINDFASSVLASHHGSVAGIITLAHANIRTLVPMAMNPQVVTFIRCSRGKSVEQFLLDVYAHTLLMEARGSMMIEFSWDLLEGNETARYQCIKYEEEATERINDLYEFVVSASKDAPTILRSCDSPTNRIAGNYAEFSNLVSGRVIRIYYREKCSNYSRYAQHHRMKDYEYCSFNDSMISQRVCRYNFTCYDANEPQNRIKFCFSNDVHRRYTAITFGDEERLCADGTASVQYWRSDFCIWCKCVCFDDDSGAGIDITPLLANTSGNRVITGLRFRKAGTLLVLEAHESTINEKGYLMKDSGAWITSGHEYVRYIRYVNMFWRSLNYNTREKVVVTGVRLGFKNMWITGSDAHVVWLEMHLSAFNPATKKLEAIPDPWIKLASHDPYYYRNCIETPTQRPTNVALVPDRYNETFCVKFGSTPLAYDAGNTYVPFFDTREVVSTTPLKSVDIGYKADYMRKSGYLAPVLYSWTNIEMAKVDNNITLRMKDVERSAGVRIYIISTRLFYAFYQFVSIVLLCTAL